MYKITLNKYFWIPEYLIHEVCEKINLGFDNETISNFTFIDSDIITKIRKKLLYEKISNQYF